MMVNNHYLVNIVITIVGQYSNYSGFIAIIVVSIVGEWLRMMAITMIAFDA